MIHRSLSVACWIGWAVLMIGAARIAWHVVMHW